MATPIREVTRTCVICGTPFPTLFARASLCSDECRNERQRQHEAAYRASLPRRPKAGKSPGRVESGKALGARRTEKACPVCGERRPMTAKQIYCTTGCKVAADKVPREAKACAFCAGPVLARKGQRFCSLHCKRGGRVPADRHHCRCCGEALPRSPSGGPGKALYCSDDCRAAMRRQRDYARKYPTLERQAAIIAARLEETQE